MNTKIILISGIFFLLFLLILFGLLYKPKFSKISIFAGKGNFNKICLKEKVTCQTDSDCLNSCSEAQEGQEIVCQSFPPLSNLTETQQKLLNMTAPQKYCVRKVPDMECSVSTGGIPTFTGWSDVERTEFDCFCSYPLWASSRVCDTETGNCTGSCKLNPGICEGGKFNWDLTKKVEEPTAGLCECPEETLLVVDTFGLPHCVPKDIQNFYTDVDSTTNLQGGQPLVSLDSITGKSFISSACATTGSSKDHTTPCKNGCCPLPNAVCCDNGNFCCPSNFPICDVENKRCLKDKSTCSQNETKCDGGCCPLSNGVCCGDGKNCCPSNFPVCDSERFSCAPLLTPLTKGNCNDTSGTQCNDGCCPLENAVCCGNGEFCCPLDYPICDTEMKACRKYALT